MITVAHKFKKHQSMTSKSSFILVLTIKIDIVFPHCAKAFKYARIWDASAHKSRKEDDVPGIADMARSLAKVESS